MEWKELRRSGAIFAAAPAIWHAEQQLPSWFRSANALWNADYGEFVAFLEDCVEIYGLFDGDSLIAAVYVEPPEPPARVVVHLSILEKRPADVLVERIAEVRTMLFRRGVRVICGWILKKNYALAAMLEKLGFAETGLTMRYGEVRGRTLKWTQFVMRAA